MRLAQTAVNLPCYFFETALAEPNTLISLHCISQ